MNEEDYEYPEADELEDSDNWDEEELDSDSEIMVPVSDVPEPPEPPKEPAKKPGTFSVYGDQLSLLDQTLKGKSDVFASKVMNIMMKCKINANDPIFLLLLAVGELELILVETPLLIEELVEQQSEQLEGLFTHYLGDGSDSRSRFEAILAEEKLKIIEAAREIIRQTQTEQLKSDLFGLARLLAPALGILIAALGIGIVGTLQYHKLVTRSLIGTGKLTPEQYAALQWAQSSEGKQAKQIMDYNKGYVGKQCKQDAEAMGLALSYNGRKVSSGFCALFVDPPDRRKYADE